MDARTLLDLAGRYRTAQDAAATQIGTPTETPEAVAAEFDEALRAYVRAVVGQTN